MNLSKINTRFMLACTMVCFITTYSFANPIKDDITKKTLTLAEFQSISLNSNYTIYLKQSNKQEVVVEALSEIYQLTKVKVENGTLVVNMEKDKSKNKSLWEKIDKIKINPHMKIYVSMKKIKNLNINGGGKIIAENSISSGNLNLSVTGSGDMDVDVKGEVLKTNISGSGKIDLKGYATSNIISLSGSGSLHAFKMTVDKAQAKLSGSGNCEINVSNELKAEIYGNGDLEHKGNTKNVIKKLYGNGTIKRAY